MLALEGRGHYDEEGIGSLGHARRLQRAGVQCFAEHSLHAGFYEMKMAGVGLFNHRRIHIHAHHLDTAAAGSDDGRGQAYVAETNETCFHCVIVLK